MDKDIEQLQVLAIVASLRQEMDGLTQRMTRLRETVEASHEPLNEELENTLAAFHDELYEFYNAVWDLETSSEQRR